MYSSDGADRFGWAIFIAGGSMPVLPLNTSQEFLKAATTMQPSDKIGKYALAGKDGVIVMADDQESVTVDLSGYSGNYNASFVDTGSGILMPGSKTITAGKTITVELPKKGAILWIRK